MKICDTENVLPCRVGIPPGHRQNVSDSKPERYLGFILTTYCDYTLGAQKFPDVSDLMRFSGTSECGMTPGSACDLIISFSRMIIILQRYNESTAVSKHA